MKTLKDENKQIENRIALIMKEAEELRDCNKKKVTRLQTVINELKESLSDISIDVNSNNKTKRNRK